MYFQVCSNSTYPQHSDERYRINGPLVMICQGKKIIICFLFVVVDESPKAYFLVG